MSNYVLDASVWIEYFLGSKRGERVYELLSQSMNHFFTNSVTLAEVISVIKRRGLNSDIATKAIVSLSTLYIGDSAFFEEVGLLHANLRQKFASFGLGDTFVLMTARKVSAKVVTCDSDFIPFKSEVSFVR